MSKKYAKLLAAGLALAVMSAGCGGEQNKPAGADPSKGAAAEKRTITFMTGTAGNIVESLKAVAVKAEEKLNISVEWEIKPDGVEGDNLVKTRLATGEMTDLLYYNSGALLTALNPEQNFADLTNEPFIDRVLDSFKQTVTVNGKVFGVPAGSSLAGAILYNKRIYKELGLTVPKTWAEFMANNEKIKAAGKTAVIASYKDSWTSQLFVLADYYNVQAKVPNFAEDYTNNKIKFATNPAALRGFKKTEEVYKAGFMNKDFLATTYDAALKMIAEGDGVHYPMLTNALDAIHANYPDQVNDIGVFPVPDDSSEINGLTVWMPNGIYVNKESPNAAAALEWIEFFVSQEGQQALSSVLNATGPYVIEGVELPEDTFDGIKEMQPYFDEGRTAPALEFLSPVKGPNLSNITVEVGSGISSAAKGAEGYDKDVVKQAKQLDLPGW